MVYYISIGNKRLGIEFAFAQFSFNLMAVYHHFCTLEGPIEKVVFYSYAIYMACIYFTLGLCNPGWISEEQKSIINKKVTQFTF